jgi:hypothetical protein
MSSRIQKRWSDPEASAKHFTDASGSDKISLETAPGRSLYLRAIKVALRTGLVPVVLVLLLGGCVGGSSYKTAPVSGRVILDKKKPLANATVEFVPVAAVGEKDRPPSSIGITDKNGHYSLMLQSASKTEGAVVGKHRVIIKLGAGAFGQQAGMPKQLPERYNRKSKLERDVPPEGTDKMDFDVQSQ